MREWGRAASRVEVLGGRATSRASIWGPHSLVGPPVARPNPPPHKRKLTSINNRDESIK